MIDRNKLEEAIVGAETWKPEVQEEWIRTAQEWKLVVEAAKAHLATLTQPPELPTIGELLGSLPDHFGKPGSPANAIRLCLLALSEFMREFPPLSSHGTTAAENLMRKLSKLVRP